MNRQSIQQVEARRAKLMVRLVRTVHELAALDKKLKKMRTGKIKVLPPPGVKVKIESNPNGLRADEFGDLIPSFGPSGGR